MPRIKGSLNKPKIKPEKISDKETKDGVPSPGVMASDLQTIKDNLTDRQLEQDEPKQRKVSKRKLAEMEDTQKKEAALEQTAQSFGVIVNMGLRFIAKRLPNPIPPSEEEEQAISEAVTGVAKKYIPSVENWTAEILLVGTLTMFIIPRVTGVKKKESEENDAVIDFKERAKDANDLK